MCDVVKKAMCKNVRVFFGCSFARVIKYTLLKLIPYRYCSVRGVIAKPGVVGTLKSRTHV